MLHYEGSHLLRLVGIVPSITAFILSFSFLKALVNGKQNLWANQVPWENLGFSLVISALKSQISSCLCLYPSVRHTLVYTRSVCEGNKRKDTEKDVLSCHLIPWEKDYVQFIWYLLDLEALFGLVLSFSRRKYTIWLLCLLKFHLGIQEITSFNLLATVVPLLCCLLLCLRPEEIILLNIRDEKNRWPRKNY